MDPSIGETHRRFVMGLLPPGGRMLEWGSGWSTLWWLNNLPPQATLRVVEHDRAWFERVRGAIPPGAPVEAILAEPTGPIGSYGSVATEDATNLQGFVEAGVIGAPYDVVLVDGWARSACLAAAGRLIKPNGTIFLHDAQRSRYDGAKQTFAEDRWRTGVIGSCPDFPMPSLWYARRRDAGSVLAPRPIVTSFSTERSAYQATAADLRDACLRLGLPHHLVETAPFGDHAFMRAYKARYSWEALNRFKRPVLWIDADARLLRAPDQLLPPDADVAIARINGSQITSAVVGFNPTPMANLLLATWIRMSQERNDIHPSVHLGRAWEVITTDQPLHTAWVSSSDVGPQGSVVAHPSRPDEEDRDAALAVARACGRPVHGPK